MKTNKENTTNENTVVEENSRPDETSGFHVEGHIKIFDPENEEVFINSRG